MQQPKFTWDQFQEFRMAFFTKELPQSLRFGQAFFFFFKDLGMNEVTDPKLFYEVDPQKAEEHIRRFYLAG